MTSWVKLIRVSGRVEILVGMGFWVIVPVVSGIVSNSAKEIIT
jgi:hypothetical protein